MTAAATRLDAAFVPVADAVAAGLIPGAVIGVRGPDGAIAIRAAGWAQTMPDKVAMRAETWFDLASLTKVIFTTTAILRLVQAGRIALDDTLATAIPDLRQYDVAGAAERQLTFRQCLSHQTHLPAVEPLYTYGQHPQTLRAFVLQRAWAAGPPVYSDINFILLGIAIERLTGRALGEQDLPAGFSWRAEAAECAATEYCQWRGRVMRGEVHDENAYALGGAAGHAGLFGTARAVLSFAGDLLDGRVLGEVGMAALRHRETPRRGLGWAIAHSGWSGGDRCTAATIGHTGFTGTGLWIDWERGLAWTLLTNRVHPTRHAETGIVPLRRRVGDLVQRDDSADSGASPVA
jgi:CubicO group peptidase (beta-lactamase class C family)